MIKIDGKIIGPKQKPFFIAEISANHSGSIKKAISSIKKAKEIGADAVKIQSYTPDTMTINSNKSDFKIKKGLWKGKNLYDLYKEAFTPFEWHKELFEYAKNIGVTLFSTAFDETSVEMLESLGSPAYKIASFELTDLPLIKKIAQLNKPIFLSTGMASIKEITESVNQIKKTGNNKILLFHCISSYPALTENSYLNNIRYLKKKFNVEVGLSDHTISNLASTNAIALGATAIEKHFKINESKDSPDSSFSLNPKAFKSMMNECITSWKSLGNNNFNRAVSENDNKIFRRSIYFIKDLKKNSTITLKDIRKIRPGFGLPPKFFHKVLGKKVRKDVKRGQALTWELIE